MTPKQRCARKVAYLSESCATNAAYLINLRNRDTGEVQVPYRCPTCLDFHLTTDRTFSSCMASA